MTMTSLVGSCFSIFSFLCDCDYDKFSEVHVSQSLVFSGIVTMTGLVGFVFLNL
jgi:hypothetical protein